MQIAPSSNHSFLNHMAFFISFVSYQCLKNILLQKGHFCSPCSQCPWYNIDNDDDDNVYDDGGDDNVIGDDDDDNDDVDDTDDDDVNDNDQ